MKIITVVDYNRPDLCYEFFQDGIKYEDVSRIKCESSTVISGIGTEKLIGVVRRRSGFFTTFVSGNKFFVGVNNKLYDIKSGEVYFKQKNFPIRIRKFEIHSNKSLLDTFMYFQWSQRVWPHDGDIFTYIRELNDSKIEKQLIFKKWSDRIKGVDITSEEYLQASSEYESQAIKATLGEKS